MAMKGSDDNLTLSEGWVGEPTYEGVIVAIIAIVLVFGIPLNACTAFIFHFKFPRTAFNTLVVGMAVYDFLSCSVTAAIDLLGVLSADSDPESSRNVVLCRATTGAIIINSQSCMIALLAVTVLRYRGVCHPLGWKLTTVHARVTIVLALLFSAPCGWTQSQLFVPMRYNLTDSMFVVDCVMAATIVSTPFGLFNFAMLLGAITGIFVVQGVLNALVVKALWFRNRIFPQPHQAQAGGQAGASFAPRQGREKVQDVGGSSQHRGLRCQGPEGEETGDGSDGNVQSETGSVPNQRCMEAFHCANSKHKSKQHTGDAIAGKAEACGQTVLGSDPGQAKQASQEGDFPRSADVSKSRDKHSAYRNSDDDTKGGKQSSFHGERPQPQPHAHPALPSIADENADEPARSNDNSKATSSRLHSSAQRSHRTSTKKLRSFLPKGGTRWLKNSLSGRGRWRTNPDTGEATSGEPSTSVSDELRSAQSTMTTAVSSSCASNEPSKNSFRPEADGDVAETDCALPAATPVVVLNSKPSATRAAGKPMTRTEVACRLILSEIEEVCARSSTASYRNLSDTVTASTSSSGTKKLFVLKKAPESVPGKSCESSCGHCQHVDPSDGTSFPEIGTCVKIPSHCVNVEPCSADLTGNDNSATADYGTSSTNNSESVSSSSNMPLCPRSSNQKSVVNTAAARAIAPGVPRGARGRWGNEASSGALDRTPRWLEPGNLRQRSLKRSVLMMLVLLSVYALSCLPAVLVFLCHVGWVYDFLPEGPASVLGRIMFRSCYVTNVAGPIVYGVWNPEFRREVKKLWAKALPARWQ